MDEPTPTIAQLQVAKFEALEAARRRHASYAEIDAIITGYNDQIDQVATAEDEAAANTRRKPESTS